MNRISAIALLAVAGFATIHSASAQSLVSRTKVPFAFTVKGITLPAGTYQIVPRLREGEIRSSTTGLTVTVTP